MYIYAYLVGSIPSGYLFAKYVHGIDITTFGSGNIGATNVARVLGSRSYFFLIFFFDFFKAFLFLFLLGNSPLVLACAVALLLGNTYSLFLQFRGGKGVATALGIVASLFPTLLIMFLLCWMMCFFYSRRVDFSSLVSFALLPLVCLMLGHYESLPLLWFILFWIMLRHKSNIATFMVSRRSNL